jgi:uncharacterized SAM-binding protein YcdF (DUF218 family)
MLKLSDSKSFALKWALFMAVAGLFVIFGLPLVSYIVMRPLVILWLVSAATLASLWRHRQDKRRRLVLLTVAFTLLTLYCLPITSYLLCRPLESLHAPMGRRPGDVEAIVVLGGALRTREAEGLPVDLAESTLYRCLRAAEMYRQGRPCPVLVSGGAVDPSPTTPPIARVMRDFLVHQGVAASDIIEESGSRSTYENAVETARLLAARGIRKILLVTDGLHMERALLCFQKQGVDAVPCSCYVSTLQFEWSATSFLPNTAAAQGVRLALHEYAGLAWYSVQGRI